LFWCSTEEKEDIKNNPDYVFYFAEKAKFEEQNKRLWSEYEIYHERNKNSTESNHSFVSFLK
jgi:hypothetical protein